MEKVRVRFAPSPTGFLHIGGARTALFNWLYAKKHNGTFILRIEDTDEARSTEESVGAILESMHWLGLNWDEGPDFEISNLKSEIKSKGKFEPYFQMERKDKGVYKEFSDKLIAEGKAYPCYCTPEEIEAMRQAAQKEKKMPKYDGRCAKLTPEERKQKESEGRKAVIRFKMPQEGKTKLVDIIRGDVEFDNTVLDDFVMVKRSGMPTYNFACVVDDHLMEISHVIRGDDHLSNTPKQVGLYQALGWELPIFAHLSMILGPDGSRLSKRHGHTSVLEYKTDGYIPKALVNYLALLGWSTEESQQVFNTIEELTEKFSLERCSKSPAVFDPQKLHWMNGEHIRIAGGEKLPETFLNWVDATNNQDKIQNWDKELLKKLLTMEFEKVKLLKDVPELFSFFFDDNYEYDPKAVEKVFKKDTAKIVLEKAIEKFSELSKKLPDAEKSEHFFPDAELFEVTTRDFTGELGFKAGQVFHPLRVAISGRTNGPSLFHIMELLGKDKVISRIKRTIKKYFV